MPSVSPPIEATSLRALADELGLPADQLNATVDEFYAAVVTAAYDPQTLDDCSTRGLTINKSHWALPIDEPPFYAYPLRPGITFTYLGLQVNETAQVKMANGPFIDNLYAAGEIMAGNILGQGYCAGTGMTIGGVFGRIAGAQAACHSK